MHLESPEHVIAVFLLGKANGPSDRILLHFAAEKPRELPTVAEVKIFTKGIKKCLIHDRIVAGGQTIVDMHREILDPPLPSRTLTQEVPQNHEHMLPFRLSQVSTETHKNQVERY